MELKLKANDTELRKIFFELQIPNDIANILEIDYSYLIYLLYRQNKSQKYKKFTLNKRNGGLREIYAPISPIKILQRKLNYILQLVFEPKACVHGFLPNKSIVTNSLMHVRKKYVFNCDLIDFFPSINFGRVRGMFISKPYNLPPNVSTVLAQLCCHENHIPQGAPTSPIISNMICARLDGDLMKLAKKCNCFYSRYADDITFSTTLGNFPERIAKVVKSEDIIQIEAGRQLQGIIDNNGFAINKEKVRLQFQSKRQEVTGLKVNEKPNVKRSLIRQIRAMLHAWEKYGLENAEKDFHNRHNSKQRNPDRHPPSFKKVVEGKINFIKMVKSEKDFIYRKFEYKFNQLIGKPSPKVFADPIKEISEALWILEPEEEVWQGTGFMLAEYGFVTCYHVLGKATHAFKHDNYVIKFPVSVIHQNKDIDLAILKIKHQEIHHLKAGDCDSLDIGDSITIAGFPNYFLGSTPLFYDGKISGRRTISGIDWMLVDRSIIAGMSGAPVVNKNNEVIGIAARGGKSMDEADRTEFQGIIPVSALKYLINNNE